MRSYIILATIILMPFEYSFAQNEWSQKADFPEARYRGVAFSIGKYGYAGTGLSPAERQNDFWKFDPVSNEWIEIASMPATGREGAIAFTIDDKAYVGGGLTDFPFPNNDFWQYDPTTDSWTQKADIPLGIVSGGTLSAFAIGSKGYVLGSYNAPADFWEYNPETDTWLQKSSFPGEGLLGQVGFEIGQKGYIATGFDGNFNVVELWEYNPLENQWISRAAFSGDPRNGAVAFSIDGFSYVGLGNSNGVFLDDFWQYNPINDEWTQIENCGYSSEGAFAMTINSRGYVGTGVSAGLGADFDVWEYKPATSTSVLEQETEHKLQVYPNPARRSIKLDPSFKSARFSIKDVGGREVMSGRVLTPEIGVSDLSVGTYIIELLHNKHTYQTRFMKIDDP